MVKQTIQIYARVKPLGKRQTPGVGEAQNSSGRAGHGVGEKTVGESQARPEAPKYCPKGALKAMTRMSENLHWHSEILKKTERLRVEQSRVH